MLNHGLADFYTAPLRISSLVFQARQIFLPNGVTGHPVIARCLMTSPHINFVAWEKVQQQTCPHRHLIWHNAVDFKRNALKLPHYLRSLYYPSRHPLSHCLAHCPTSHVPTNPSCPPATFRNDVAINPCSASSEETTSHPERDRVPRVNMSTGSAELLIETCGKMMCSQGRFCHHG